VPAVLTWFCNVFHQPLSLLQGTNDANRRLMSGEGGFESDFFTHPSLRGDTDVNPEVPELVPGL
jgi:hypothetical protein